MSTNNAIEQARADLDRAREAHAAAIVAKMAVPSLDADRRLKDAEQQGQSAWKGYQTAATAGLAAEIESLVPGSFLE